MLTSTDISLLIVTKNIDSARLRLVYNHLRNQYPENEIVIVYDSVPIELSDVADAHLKQISTSERVYVSGGYNTAIKASTKKGFVFLHDDTFTAKNFLENLVPHISEQTFVNFITVEPPKFGNVDNFLRPIRDFGTLGNDFQKENFDIFVDEYTNKLQTVSQPSPFGGFFMAGYKNSFLSVGGFDETFKPFFSEDSDLMVRLLFSGYKFTLVLNSLVYHMVSLTSRTIDESRYAERITADLFLQKWKTTFENIKKYSISNKMQYVFPKVKINCNSCSEGLRRFFSLLESADYTIAIDVDEKFFGDVEFQLLLQLPYLLKDVQVGQQYQLGSMLLRS